MVAGVSDKRRSYPALERGSGDRLERRGGLSQRQFVLWRGARRTRTMADTSHIRLMSQWVAVALQRKSPLFHESSVVRPRHRSCRHLKICKETVQKHYQLTVDAPNDWRTLNWVPILVQRQVPAVDQPLVAWSRLFSNAFLPVV